MKIALIITAPVLCLLSACSEEAEAPVLDDEVPVDAEMPPQPEINDSLTEEEADAALEELQAEQQALEDSAETESSAEDSEETGSE